MATPALPLCLSALLLVAGCMDRDDPPGGPTPEEPAGPGATTATPGLPSPTRVLLLDHNWTHSALESFPIFQDEVVIGSANLTAEWMLLRVEVERSSHNVHAFPNQIRLYDPDGELADEAEFSDQQAGNVLSTGNASVRAEAPRLGLWTVAYVTDNVDRGDTSTGRTRMWAEG